MDAQRQLDALLAHVQRTARLLPALTPENGASERRRLVAALSRGEHAVPRWTHRPALPTRDAFRALERAGELAGELDTGPIYLPRIDELDLELTLVGDVGQPKRVRPLSARRFGTGATKVFADGAHVPLRAVADRILAGVEDDREEATLPAHDPHGGPSCVSFMEALCVACHLEVEVKVEPRLVSKAAAGERSIFVADQRFGEREARRLAVHEVLGHMVAAVNGRLQPIGIFSIGTAGAFEDQEGLAVCLEEAAGLLDGHRLRVLAARVVAADLMHDGASFHETATQLARDHGFVVEDAVAIAERAHRGGGVARDVGYLRGYLRVRAALASGTTSIDELRTGKVSLEALPLVRSLRERGLARAPVYRPSLARSFGATVRGTSFETSPPSFVTSLQSPDAT